MELQEMYGLGENQVASMAVANEFVKTLNKVCYALGKQMKPFGFYNQEEKQKAGVIDFANFQGVVNTSSTIEEEIAEVRLQQLKAGGVTFAPTTDLQKKTLLYDYLLSTSVCYVEEPKVFVKKEGGVTKGYNKYFATKNPRLMALWINGNQSEVQIKYSNRCKSTGVDLADNKLRLIRLNKSSVKGTSLSVPRNAISTEKLTVYPLFTLNAFMRGMEEHLNNEIVEFTFLKDNGTERVIPTTLNRAIMDDYYTDKQFVDRALHSVSIFDEELGGMKLSSKMSRGYIRVPELGSSMYDDTGTRSVNLARILKIRVVNEVSREFIDVALDSVQEAFSTEFDKILVKEPAKIKEIAETLMNVSIDDKTPVQIATEVRTWVENNMIILSTDFKRMLHRFMISHPEWFPSYTGKPIKTVESSKDFGVEALPF